MKRYKEYKDSGVQWIGKVPSHWVVSRLKYFCEPLKSGGTPKSDESRFYAAEGTPWVAIADMSSTPLVIDTAKHLTEEGIADKNLNIFPPGTILYSIYATLGKVSELAVPACINQAILAINPDKRYCKTYFKYCLTAQEQYVYSLSNGNTQNNLNAEKVANFFMVLPPLIEQQVIASFLDAKTKPIDDIIAKRERQIELLEEMKSAIISRAVTKGLNPEAKMKDSGIEWIGEVPEEWEISKVKYIANVCGRIGYRGYTTNDLVSAGEGALTIGGKHITHNYLNLSDPDYISWEKYYDSPEIMLEKGDIVMAQRGSLGKSALIDREIGEATINPSLVILKRIKANGIFLHYYLISNMMQDYINLINTATAVPMISQNQIENIPVALPPLSEQQAIASYLDSETSKIDSRIAKRRRQIELLQEYKQALITAAVTGKIDVREYNS